MVELTCRASLRAGRLVIVNESPQKITIKRVEVEYHVVGIRWEAGGSGRDYRRVRRLVREVLGVGQEVEPGKSLELYFGEVEGLERVKVYATVAGSGEEYVVECKVES